jgi:hypothetical protein
VVSVRGGRPLAIDDESLFNWRDGFLNLFIDRWGHFGWVLRAATTREDIVSAFSSIEIPAQWTNLVVPFIRRTDETATARDIHAGRRALEDTRQPVIDFEERLRPLADAVRETQRVLTIGVSPERLERIRAEHRARLEAYGPVRAKAEALDIEVSDLQSRQRDIEAAFAQDELLLFLNRVVYKFNPRNLAHAVAGLPYIGWRHSFRRCAQRSSWLWPSPLYCAFEVIEASANTADSVFVNSLRERIQTLPASPARKALSDKFYCLRVAVEEAVAAMEDGVTCDELPFRTFTLYVRNISQGQTNEERVIASLERIDR